MKRYVIQMAYLNDSLKGKEQWTHFYSAHSSHTLRGARKEFWHWANYPWEFTSDHERTMFRIYDTKKNEAVE